MGLTETSKRGPAELYLDLLKKCLTRLIFPDSSVDMRRLIPTGKFDAEERRNGVDWPSEAETMVGWQRLNNIQWCVEQVLQDQVPGDLLEAGVWRGGSSILMRGVLEAHGDRSRTVWVADSFAGFPPFDPVRSPRDAALDLTRYNPFVAISLEQVQANFAKYGLLDDQVRFLKGWFCDTLPDAPIGRIAVLRLDGDLYESTVNILDSLYHKVSPGGFVIVDDYGALASCREAVDDFRVLHGIQEPLEAIDWTGVFWRREPVPKPKRTSVAPGRSAAPSPAPPVAPRVAKELRPLLVHVHQPKTGGTSFQHALSRYRPDTHLDLYVDDNLFVYPEEELARIIEANPGVESISSHFIRTFPPVIGNRRCYYATVLREPSEIVASYIRYIRKAGSHLKDPALLRQLPANASEITAREFAAHMMAQPFSDGHTVNYFSWYPWIFAKRSERDPRLCSLASCSETEAAQFRTERLELAQSILSGFLFVGLLKRLNDAMPGFRRKCRDVGLTLIPSTYLERENTTDKIAADFSWLTPSDEVGSRVLAAQAEDVRLYEWARRRDIGASQDC